MGNAIPDRKEVGRKGEDIAAIFLQRRGFTVLHRNYWKPFGEIDLIVEKGGVVHFVEVKSVSRESIADISRETNEYRPEELVHARKIQRLQRAIQTYLAEKREDREFQIDVVGVFLDFKRKTARCRLFERV